MNSQKIKYFYPLLIFIFFVNYHFYSFYQSNFLSMFKIISKQKKGNFYEKIQSQNPYYEVWQLFNKKGKKIIFINTDQDERFIDYNATYFKNINQKNKINYYLTELNLMIKYFSYPRIVPTYSFYQLIINSKIIDSVDFIVSDYEFEDFYKKTVENNQQSSYQKTKDQILFEKNFLTIFKRLKRLNVSDKEYISVVRHKEKPYYIYQIIKNRHDQ